METVAGFLRDSWRLSKPYFTQSEERRSAWALLLGVILCELIGVGMGVVATYNQNLIYDALSRRDFPTFLSLLFTWGHSDYGIVPGFVTLAIVIILFGVYGIYLQEVLQLRWRRWMTRQFIEGWTAANVFFHMTLEGDDHDDGSDNPDQRIQDDINSFTNDTLSLGISLMSNVVTLFSYVGILWVLSGSVTIFGIPIRGYLVWAALIYSALGTWATHLMGRPLSGLQFRQQRVEADLRYGLVRVKDNAEGIALQHGQREERSALDARFGAVYANSWRIIRRTRLLNFAINGFNEVSTLFVFAMAAPRYFAGKITLGDFTQANQAFASVQGAMSWFVTTYGSIASYRAEVERLRTFQDRIAEMTRLDAARTVAAADADGRIALSRLAALLPNGEALLTVDKLALSPGQSVAITGRSGSGKSTLFRVLAGIWPRVDGSLALPEGRMLFLPQRPYIPVGTLRRAACYPQRSEDVSDPVLQEALAAVGLSRLYDDRDVGASWAQRLSPGEQQRLAIARALLLKPDWLFLDEATASLDPAAEAELYALLRQRLPGSTIVSITHQPAVAAAHDRHLRFEREADGAARLIMA